MSHVAKNCLALINYVLQTNMKIQVPHIIVIVEEFILLTMPLDISPSVTWICDSCLYELEQTGTDNVIFR